VVPHSYLEFMIVAAGAAGAMIGLLFVAISLRSELVLGPNALGKVRTLAGSSFTSLVNAFSLAILAIIPKTNIGLGMIFVALFCLVNTWHIHLRNRHFKGQVYVLAFSNATYLYEFAAGVVLLARSHELWIVESLCYVIFASFVIALNRAWTFISSDVTTPTNS
jgi:hypothetical protein